MHGGARKLELILFLFSGKVFFEAIEEMLGNNCEMNKNDVRLALKCPNFGPLLLGEVAFALVKGLECGKTQGVRLNEGLFAIGKPQGMPNGDLGSPL